MTSHHRRFPDELAFTLNNPIRRLLEPPDRLVAKLNVGARDVVLDFGCGTGFFTIPLAKVSARTIGADVSPEMLERTGSYAKRSGVRVELIESDGTAFKLPDEAVDMVFLNHVFHEIERRTTVLSEFLRIVKTSGRLVVVERTQGNFLCGKLGPPVIDEKEVIRELEHAGFSLAEAIAHGKDTAIVSRRTLNTRR